MQMLPKLIALVTMCALVAGCQSTKTRSIVTTDKPVCTVWKGVSYSAKRDTPETVREVRANNAARTAYCK